MLRKKVDIASERLTSLLRIAHLKLMYIMANFSLATVYDKVKGAVWDKWQERGI